MRDTVPSAAWLIAAIGAVTLPATAQAQNGPLRVAIGSFKSERQCTLYAVTSGSESAYARSGSAGYIGPFGAGGASSSEMAYQRQWKTELVRDCTNNFVALRQSIEAAIAASGHIVVVPAGTRGAYTLSGQVSEAGVMTSTINGGGVSQGTADAALNVQFSLRNARGTVVNGNLITKRLNIGTVSNNGLADYSSSTSGRSIYTQLQRETALAVARSVAFNLDPLRVTQVSGQRVQLNYGKPFLEPGGTVFLEGAEGRQIKTNIASASNGSAWVETYGDGDMGSVMVGSTATFVEADDPAGNTPAFERVDLP